MSGPLRASDLSPTGLLLRLIYIGCLIAAIVLMSSCSFGPTVYQHNGRTVAHLGSSMLTRSADDMASITLPDGTMMARRTIGRDEVTGAVRRAQWAAMPGIVKSISSSAVKAIHP